MTVSPEYNTITYTANGTTTDFPWTYDYDKTYGTLIVTETTTGTTYVEGTDYTIVDKTVVFNTAPEDGLKIKLERKSYRGQQTAFIEGEDFPAEDFENSLDRIIMIEQEQDKNISDEQNAREEADTTLQNNIDSEALTRSGADTGLQNQITAEVARAKSVEGSLSNLTTLDKNNLVAAIDEVDAHIDSISGTMSNYGNIVTHNVSEFATAAQGTKADTALQPAALGDATLTIKRNNTSVGTFSANAKTDKAINITVPVDADDVGALPDTTKYGASINMSLNTTDYKLTVSLKDQDGNTLNSKTVDFPVENVVVSGTYDSQNQKIVLTLVNGNKIDIPVGALISGLQSEITAQNKLDSDLVNDTNQTNKFVTASEKSTWNGKQDSISDLETIRSGAAAGATAVQSGDLATVATSGSYNDLDNIPTIGNATITLKQGGVTKGSFTLNQTTNAEIVLETTEDYSTQSHTWAEGNDAAVQALGGTHSSRVWAEIAEAAASGVQNPANRDLSNLTADGQMIIDSQNGTISNCILEIPQNIKCEINSGVLTLKSGSTYVNTGEVYSTTTTTSDGTIDISGYNDGTYVIFPYGNGGLVRALIERSQSGSSLPETYYASANAFFLTTDKSIYAYSNGAWTKTSNGYPICIVIKDSNGVRFAKDSKGRDLIFNGCGFIGQHAFVYPNVKVLMPDGFNTDGSLKSTTVKTVALSIYGIGTTVLSIGGSINTSGYYEESEDKPATNYTLWYKPSTNTMYRISGSGEVSVNNGTPFVTASYNGSVVTKFDIRQPYEGARDLLTDSLQADVTTLAGYDSTQTQTLKNINGVLTWVTD